MRVIVHIGMEKTGTTTIQALLYRNRETLAERGFHVLRCAGRSNHRAIPSYCMRANRRDDYLRNRLVDNPEKRESFREKLREEFIHEIDSLDGHLHTVLITSEHFHSLLEHQDELETLRELLQVCFSDIRILVYLREQVDTVLSRYSTAIKAGRTKELDIFLDTCRADSGFYNYDMMLARWEQVFGQERIEVALFSRQDFIAQDLVTDFLSRIDPSLVGALDTEIETENESLNSLGQTIGRAINLAFPSFEDSVGINPLRTRLMDINYRRFRGRGESIAREKRELLSDQFKAGNEAIRKRYFPDRDHLFATPTEKPQSAADEKDLAPALMEMFQLVLADNYVVPQRYVDIFRDAAVILEKHDLDLAYELMNLAHRMRPDGPFIKARRNEYLKRGVSSDPKLPTGPKKGKT